MIICSCKVISDKDIRKLVQEGFKSLKELMAACPIGRDCGSCLCQTKQLLSELDCPTEQSDC